MPYIHNEVISYLLCKLVLHSDVYSQKGNKGVKTNNVSSGTNVQILCKNDSLYADYDNEIEIRIPALLNMYGITVSQGSIRNNNDSAKNISGLNILSGLKQGNVTITIYRNNQLYKQRTFGIREKFYPQYKRRINKFLPNQPVISLAGIDSGGPINRKQLLNAIKLDINSPYRILKYTVLIQPDEIMLIHMYSKYFSKELKSGLDHLSRYKDIYIDEILIEDEEGTIYWHDPILYKVID